MIRRAAFAFAGVVALTASPVIARAQGITAAPGGQMSSLAGMAFDVPIVLDMSARPELLGAFAARLTWDPARLRLDAGSPGSFGAVTTAADSAAQGILRVAGANPAGVGGRITLGTLRFTPLLPDTATLSLSFSQLYAAQSFADLLPNLTATGGQFCPARGRFGDLDRDGAAGSRDALLALSAAVGIDVAPADTAMGDVDASGATNARDALGILTHTVGLPTPGFRVLALAMGPCAIGGAVTLQITPGVAGDLVIGQGLRLEARALDGAGGLQAIPDATWRSSNPSVAAVGPDGIVSARAVGTALVTAVRAGQDSATLSINVVSRRTRHFVDAAALQAVNATGDPALPFGNLRDAILVAGDQDTIQVRLGRYEPALAVASQRRLTIIGDTSAGGARPIIAGHGPASGEFGLAFAGNDSVAVAHLGFDNLLGAISVQGGKRLMLTGLRGDLVGSLVSSNGPLGHLRLDKTVLSGDATSFMPALALLGPTDTVAVTDSRLTDFGGQFIFAQDVDSIAILRSHVANFASNGLDVDNIEARGRGVAISVDSSQLRRFSGEAIEATDPRSVVVRWSTLEASDLFYLYHATGGGRLHLLSDSLLGDNGDDWLTAEGLDSVVIDSVYGNMQDAYGWVYNVALTRVTNTTFTGTYYFLEASLGSSSTTRPNARVEIRNSDISGLADCSQCGYGLDIDDKIFVIVDSTRFSNLSYSMELFVDTSAIVTNSTFRNVYEGIVYSAQYSPGCTSCGGDPTATLTARGNRFENTEYAIEAFGGNITIDSNVVDVSDDGIEIDSWGTIQVTRNTISNSYYGIDAEIDDSTGTLIIEDNVLTGVEYYGIEADAGSSPDSLHGRIRIQRNLVDCTGGYTGSYGIQSGYGDMTVADNVVVNCAYGIDTYSFTTTTRVDSLLRNRVTLPANSYEGLSSSGRLRIVSRGNHVSGPATAGTNSGGMVTHSGETGAGTALLVDRDTILGGARSGISLSSFDTIAVLHSVINDPNSQNGFAGIFMTGDLGADTIRIKGNEIRRSGGVGLYANFHSVGVLLVDSNLVSKSATSGLQLGQGTHVVRRNMIDSSGTVGVNIGTFSGAVFLDSNNIQGNVMHGAINPLGASVTAANNWWGHASGPSCLSGCNSPAGDSVDAFVPFTPFLTAPYAGTPPITAPPAFLASPVTRPSALRGASGSRPRIQRAAPAPRQRPDAAAAAAREASAIPRPVAEAVRSRQAARAARDAARRQIIAERDRRDAERRQAIEQRRRDDDAPRQTRSRP